VCVYLSLLPIDRNADVIFFSSKIFSANGFLVFGPVDKNRGSASLGGRRDFSHPTPPPSSLEGGRQLPRMGRGLQIDLNTVDDKLKKRLMKNRRTAELSRQRKLSTIKELQDQIARLQGRTVDTLTRQQLADLRAEHEEVMRRVTDQQTLMELEDEVGVTTGFVCPLGLCTMRDPVIAADGVSYERLHIERHIQCCQVCTPSNSFFLLLVRLGCHQCWGLPNAQACARCSVARRDGAC